MLSIAGPVAPLVTPLTDDGSALSEVRLSRLVRLLIERQLSGLVVASETGEFGSLAFGERKQLTEWVHRETRGDLPLLVHVSTLSTGASVDLAQHADRHGAQAAVLMPPHYGVFSDDEIEAHFRTVAHYGGLPVLAVDPLGRIDPGLAARLGALPGVFVAEGLGSARPRSDRCILGEMEVSPLFLLNQPPRDIASILELMESRGPDRVMKAALALQGFDAGGLRQPNRALPGRESELLESALADYSA
ncbi:MAG: dihydrodipicolinate synthase family protein [Fimbriimonas ginsengisoli]|nr:dihydrodipicolinate synthase family protein [Fimbriimonas ginsengisoli]